MDDYHEFEHAYEMKIKEWWLYWSPNYIFIIRGTMASSGATTILSINLANGNASGSGTIRSGGVGASNNLGRIHNYH
jgi:hypothetical protein